ncbi:MAG: hypothetical protein K5865_00965 [Eubacterium sp.]|nr:hypothetical protein [Eubacterium sp.]MCR4845293.1 hypothetical protein [Eubacterium sp.]
MARHSLFGGLLTITAAAAAAAGVCYLFKEEIRGTETYKNLNEKYDVDTKIKKASEKARDTAYDLKDKAKVAAKDIKTKADEWKASKESAFEDDEIITDEDFSEDRDYVSINDAAADTAAEATENAADASADANPDPA